MPMIVKTIRLSAYNLKGEPIDRKLKPNHNEGQDRKHNKRR